VDRRYSGYNSASGMAEFIVKNRFSVGDTVELIMPAGNTTFSVESINDARYGNPMPVAPGSGHVVNIPVPVKPDAHALLAVHLRH